MAPLTEYAANRDLDASPEPGATASDADVPIFVIQQHDAQTLHYDFRLAVGGVLVSWAVPKGPSTDPSEKRLALRTENHPLDYADFEGVIPKGHYGAGPVLVWDTGPYRNLRAKKEDASVSMEQALDDGKIEVDLEGEKIKGGYALIRTDDAEDRWLLIKMDDEHADARRHPTSTEPESVLSGRTIDDLAQEAGADDE